MNTLTSKAKQAYLDHLDELKRQSQQRDQLAKEEKAAALSVLLDLAIDSGHIPEEFREYAFIDDPVGVRACIGENRWYDFLIWVKYLDYPTVKVEVHVTPTGNSDAATYRVWSSSNDPFARPKVFYNWDVAFGYAVWLYEQNGGLQ